MIKNTENKNKIINKQIKRIMIKSGIAVTSLFLTGCSPTLQNNTRSEINMNEDYSEEDYEINNGYNQYSVIYINQLSELNEEDFDKKFIDIYNNGTITIDNVKYDVKQIYLKTMDDNSIHYIIAGENKTDLLTSKEITGNRTGTYSFRNASIFYQMYQDGIITSTNSTVDKDILQKYADQWDKKEHTQVPELKAQEEADKEYKRVYGK